MRLAVLSDIHGNLPALEAVRAEIAAERFDLVVNLGDIVSGPLWPRETAARLMALGWPTIAGNHERQALATLACAPADGPPDDDAFAAAALGPAELGWLRSLPAEAALLGGAVHLVHGTARSDLEPLLETVIAGATADGHPGIRAATPAEIHARVVRFAQDAAVSLVLCGHSHVPRGVVLARGDSRLSPLVIVNPGSVGRPAYAHDRPFPHEVETVSPHARWAVVQRTAAGWGFELRATAYDHAAAAARAEHSGTADAADWAHELRTGRTRRATA
jgi:predicted phosphodiesterase